ncbi:MAG: acyl-CoA dehydrogenase [Henriciella sp.]|nr:acyl-CoA dehydrogenase [Henriciella sp.]
MDFLFSDEQDMLFQSADRFGQERFACLGRAELLSDPEQAELGRLWHDMAELGWLMLTIDEAAGGIGAGSGEVMALMQAMGKHLIPSAYVATCILVPALLKGDEDAAQTVLAKIGDGSAKASGAFFEADSGYHLHHVQLEAVRKGDTYVLNGQKCHVEDGADADWFVVSARTSGASSERLGISLFLVPKDAPGLEVEKFRAIDGHRHAKLHLREVTNAVLIGEQDNAIANIESAVALANCAHLAEASGSMRAAADLTLEYLKTREQFGQPIGKFQVLQHRMVDMMMGCEEAESMVFDAAQLADRAEPIDPLAVCAAKVRVGQCGLYVTQQAVQLHGGIGFSDEIIVSHHLRRQMMLNLAYGSIDHYRSVYAEGQ